MSERALRRNHERRVATAGKRRRRLARRTGIAATAAAGAIGVLAPSAQAAPFDVNTTSDHAPDGACDAAPDCTLREAVIAANANGVDDTITFQAGLSGTINLSQGTQITIDDVNDLDIQGPGLGTLAVSGDTTGDGRTADDTRVFYVADTPGYGYVSISGLTLTAGYATSGDGGALYTEAGGGGPSSYTQVELDDVAVTNSIADGDGGGIAANGGLTVSDSTISGNEAPNGSGAGIYAQKYLGVDHSTISGNFADDLGGGIEHFGKYGMQVSDSAISGNSASVGGGFNQATQTPFKYSDNLITDTSITGNTATEAGAGANIKYMNGGDRFTISHSTLSGNNGPSYGGGLSFSGYGPGPPYFNDTPINGTFEALDTTISGNSADTGGGVSVGPCGCGPPGEPVLGPNGSIEFNNSTIASNTASTAGGGIYLSQYYDGGSPPYYSATIPLNSTIVADNTAAGANQDLDRGNDSTSGGFDLAFSLVEAPGDALLSNNTSILGTDPKLGPLASNGGPTETQLPADTSPAIDQGHAPLSLKTDQRGEKRTVETPIPNPPGGDGTDIGSVELGSVPVGPQTQLEAGKNRPPKKVKTRKKFKKFKVNFGADQPGARFQCKVDSGPLRPCTSPFTAKLKSKKGKGLLHSITIQAVDASGKASGSPFRFFVRVVRIPRRHKRPGTTAPGK